MRAIISAKLLSSKEAQPAEKPFEIRDTRLQGFILRVQPSGVRSFNAEWGRGKRVALGKVGQYTAEQARDRCERVLGNVAHDRPPLEGLEGTDSTPTLAVWLEDTYEPWLKATKPRGADYTIEVIERYFKTWLTDSLKVITVARVETWKAEKLTDGLKPTTVMRALAALSGALSHAVRTDKLQDNPIRKVVKPKIDRKPKPRYLNDAEEARLRAALAERDQKMQAARESANAWRKARKHEPFPPLKHFGDHLTPAVLISMNTGLRRGELLKLQWTDIDQKGKMLTVRGETTKTGQTREVPLNAQALDTFKRWKEQASDDERVFTVTTTFKTAWSELLTQAKITRFRWHDLRHHFASRLAQKATSLQVIQELLGHESLAMTIRYSHLSPAMHRSAVDALNEPTKTGESARA
jgi:integrase